MTLLLTQKGGGGAGVSHLLTMMKVEEVGGGGGVSHFFTKGGRGGVSHLLPRKKGKKIAICEVVNHILPIMEVEKEHESHLLTQVEGVSHLPPRMEVEGL